MQTSSSFAADDPEKNRGKIAHLQIDPETHKTACGRTGKGDFRHEPPPPTICKTCDRIERKKNGNYELKFKDGHWVASWPGVVWMTNQWQNGNAYTTGSNSFTIQYQYWTAA